jgi:hypothetical protein
MPHRHTCTASGTCYTETGNNHRMKWHNSIFMETVKYLLIFWLQYNTNHFIYQSLQLHKLSKLSHINHISVLASNGIDRGLEPWSGKIKGYKIGICCFSAKHAALNLKEKEQRLFGSESEYCVRVEWHFYPQTVVSVS